MFIILVIICLVRITLLKEILIAASELNMTNGEFAFVGFELDLYAAWNRQSFSFKWASPDFSIGILGKYEPYFFHSV